MQKWAVAHVQPLILSLSDEKNGGVFYASSGGHRGNLEAVKLLLTDDQVDPSATKRQVILTWAQKAMIGTTLCAKIIRTSD